MPATTFVRLMLAAMMLGALLVLVTVSARACSPGAGHPEYPNIVCNGDGESWRPAAGYFWAVPNDLSDLNVRRLVYGDLHPTYPNIVWTDNGWQPMTGYEWTSDDPSDLSVRPMAGADADPSTATENTALDVENNTDNYVTVSVDGAYGCNTAGFTTCTIPVEVGPHNLYAVKTENGATFELDVYIGADGYRWIIVE